MNTDFRVSVDFSSNFKIKKLKKKLGAEGVLSLFVLWSYAAKHRPEGVFYDMEAEDIELVVDWEGEEGAFVAILFELRLLETNNHGHFYLHDFNEHNPWVTTVNDRQDKARFSRLAAINREKYDELKAQGINGISKADYDEILNTRKKNNKYEMLTASNGRQTVVKRSLDAASTPSPSPSPNEIKNKNLPPHKPPLGGGCVGEDKKPKLNSTPEKPEPVPKAKKQDCQETKPAKTAKGVKPNTNGALKAEIAGYARTPDLQRALKDFCEMREKIRKPLTSRALQLIFDKLDELSSGLESCKVQIVEQSVMNSWQGVFPLSCRGPNGQAQQAGTLAQRNLAALDRVLARKSQTGA